MAEDHELPWELDAMPPAPRNFFEMNMRWDAIWYILRHFRHRILTSCALTSSRLDDFLYVVTYILIITFFFFGGGGWGGEEAGRFGGGNLLPLKYPR